MLRRQWQYGGRWFFATAATVTGLALTSCGGGTERDSGPDKTYLSVAASDPDGDGLHYQWRVTGGAIENRDSPQTVWTMPAGPGLHFAYVVVSDGKGGYVEQQYAVATDALDTSAPVRQARAYEAPVRQDPEGSTPRLRFALSSKTVFAAEPGKTRYVYLPEMQIVLLDGTSVVFSGATDASGEVNFPFLAAGKTYEIRCATSAGSAPKPCGTIIGGSSPTFAGSLRFVEALSQVLGADRNLRLFGHVALQRSDGSACGTQNDFFGLQRAATVQLLQSDGTPVTPAIRVNRFGDYALDAAVAVDADLRLQVVCEGYRSELLAVPRPAGGYLGTAVELSHEIANRRPRIEKVVANGPEGNVRGEMVVLTEAGAQSNGLPGPDQFLVYKGKDGARSACNYYRSLGAVQGCDAQGQMTGGISFDDWKARHGFGKDDDVKATYINRMDLNLVRRMVATRSAPDHIAFYVCNHPGPEGGSQAEVDEVLDVARSGEKMVACVAMEWSVSPGVNGGKPFTKFLTFGPDGALLPSINLDGRGEKYMPGACVACHGGNRYSGNFAATGDVSPNLGSSFLPFDIGNFLFGSATSLTAASQNDAIWALNDLVKATEVDKPTSAVRTVIDGWYGSGKAFSHDYVGSGWLGGTDAAGQAKFYKAIIGSGCRTCHVAMGANFDWDAIALTNPGARNVGAHVCGGSADIALNASMPNALMSRDRIADRLRSDGDLADLMKRYFGCTQPQPDPAYARR